METAKRASGVVSCTAGAVLCLLPVPAAPALASDTPDPASVTIAGSLQSELGCAGDWDPACTATQLAYDADDTVWQQTFSLPAGSYEYKAALNGGWTENYGAHALRDGPNIPLDLAADGSVKFYYSHATHWVASNRDAVIATAPGSYQSELGCPGDWDPSCLRSWLQDPDGDGVHSFVTTALPAGSYEVKVAIDESWDENYGAGGVQNGANIPFEVPSDCSPMLFRYDAATHVLEIAVVPAVVPQPASVTVAGSFQDEVGCAGDWDPACGATHLAFDAEDGVWQNSFTIPAGGWEYKAALNDGWDENYGANAQRNGPNINLALGAEASVKFYYSHQTHWVTSNRNAEIATAPGSYQHFLGCAGDWDPACLRSWLQDPDGDGIYVFSTNAIPAGNYEAKVAIDESWDVNYGAGGVQNGPNIAFTVPASCTEMFFVYDSVTHILTIGAAGGPKGNLALARAHWVDRATIAWNIAPVAGASYLLHSAPDGGLTLTSEGVAGGETIPLALDPAGLPDAVKARFPHLAAYAALKLPADQLDRVPELLKGQLAISASAADGTPLDATSLQLPGVIDDLYTYDGPLGIAWRAGKAPTLRVWAPTARSMRLLLFDDSDPASPGTAIAMQHDPASGVWTVEGERGWNGKFYLYELTVFVRQTGRVEVNQVTDPYSISLSLNGRRSQIVDLDDPALKPPGWDGVAKPKLAAPTDVVLYELHVRDFSANDASVPPPLRGTFQAFAARGSAGSRHLAALAQAGVSHVHLLPAFDFATVEEDKSLWQQPAGDLASYPPDSDQQQAAVMAVADRDPYNWGYDPFHYMVPEGSYATDPDGPARIREFRAMVQALNRAGLRVVMDVVFNHTSAAGQDEKSVLDRLVPGYYHRLNADGMIENSTCCQNTATEHAMMEKLMLDALVLWAKAYKVDGFRFDLMGHHMLSNMVKVRDTLHALTIPRDGVDGSQIYLYGEAWNFGEVANEARGVNATQLNIGGLGIGSFNDRGRDGARGGGPFAPLRDQGYLTGLALDPNGTPQGSADEQLARLLHQKDWIRAMLAGNLRDYELVDAAGNRVPASQIDYNGQPAGYTLRPEESINYVSAHDNETLFDAVQLKAAADATLADRVRMHNLGLSLLGLGQGVPFFHAGDELLRSKSMDRDSYNSGDWFNKIDWSYDSDNWGVGLPPAEKNSANWPLMQPLLADPELKPGPAEIRRTLEHFLEINAIRRSSHLFRLPAADEIMAKLRFHNTGPGQLPGLIVMSLAENTGDAWGTCGAGSPGRRAAKKIRALDYDFAVVLFNADKDAVSFADPAFAGLRLALHPVQLGSNDPLLRASAFDSASGTFTIPPRTASVFVCSGDGPLAYKTKHRRQK